MLNGISWPGRRCSGRHRLAPRRLTRRTGSARPTGTGSRRSRPLAVTAPGLALITIATLTALTALAGCSSSASSSGPAASAASPASSGNGEAAAPAAASIPSASAAGPAAGSAAGGYAAAGSSTSSAGVGGQQAGSGQASSARYLADGQQLIYTAQLKVRAKNVGAALSTATSIVTAAGGYVSAENSTGTGAGQPASSATATVTLKIPAAVYPATLARLDGSGLGAQLSLQQQAQDVTQQVADVSSMVASDQAAITQLRSLLKDAGSVSALLQVQDQINSETSDLESMLAQQQALNHETAFATVTLTLVGPKAAVKPKAARKVAPPPGLASGLTGGWRAFRLTIDWLLAVLGAVAPFAAAVVVIAGVAWWARRRMTRGAGTGTGTTGTAGTAGPAGD
jgi:Domain of unknown function (DUF4349)